MINNMKGQIPHSGKSLLLNLHDPGGGRRKKNMKNTNYVLLKNKSTLAEKTESVNYNCFDFLIPNLINIIVNPNCMACITDTNFAGRHNIHRLRQNSKEVFNSFSSLIPLLNAQRVKPAQPAELLNCLNANSEQSALQIGMLPLAVPRIASP